MASRRTGLSTEKKAARLTDSRRSSRTNSEKPAGFYNEESHSESESEEFGTPKKMPDDEKPVLLTEAALSKLVGTKSGPVKLPTFWPSRPKAWFIRIEAEFTRRKITDQSDKFNHVLSALEDEHIDEIGNKLDDLDSQTPYDLVKTALLTAFGETKSDAFTYIFGNNLPPYDYDLRPSQFMNQLLKRADANLKKSDTLKTVFVRRLPPAISTIAANIAPTYTDLMQFAEKCDDLFENEKTKIAKPVNNVKTVLTEANVGENAEGENFGENPLSVNAMRGQFRGRGFPPRGFRGNYGRGSRGRQNRGFRQPSAICVYHSRYGDEARMCLMPCSYPNNKFKN